MLTSTIVLAGCNIDSDTVQDALDSSSVVEDATSTDSSTSTDSDSTDTDADDSDSDDSSTSTDSDDSDSDDSSTSTDSDDSDSDDNSSDTSTDASTKSISVAIEEPSFENGGEAWTLTNATITDDDSYSGDYAAELSDSDSLVEQTISVNSNTTYVLTVQVMGSAIIGAVIDSTTYSESVSADMDDWSELSVEFEVGDETEITIFAQGNDDDGLIDYFEISESGATDVDDDSDSDNSDSDDSATDDGDEDDSTDDSTSDDSTSDDNETDDTTDDSSDDSTTDDDTDEDDSTDDSANSDDSADEDTADIIDTGESNFTRGSLGDNDTVPTISCDTTVSSTSALEDAVSETMEAGTTICLADGEYTDLELQFGGTGTESAPIKVAAETSGGVTIGGTVLVRMGGEYVQLQGFIFKDGTSDGDLIQTRLGSDPTEFCYNCRITEISVIDMDEDAEDSNRWVHLYGEYNRVDHSYFSGKSNAGSLLTVSRELSDYVTDAADSYGNYMTIDHNYFGDRPPANGKAYADSDDNEYEAIRIGTSETHSSDSNSTVEYNYLEKIQGEAEVISNKSGNNTIRYNTIRDSYGSLTTRHGSSVTIQGNVIIGDDHPYAGGIRVVDSDHSIFNNYIEGARYKDTTHHGGIVLMGSTVSSTGSTENGYQYFSDVMVANNTIVDSVNSLNVDGGNKSYNPESVYLVNNLIQDGIGAVITQSDDGMPENSTIEGNVFYGQSYADSDTITDDSVYGITWLDVDLETDSLGIYRPTDDSSADLEVAAYSNSYFESIDDDMDGQTRSSMTLAGADEIATSTTTVGLLNRYDVGPMSYTPEATDPHVAEVTIDNYDFDNGSSDWTLSDASISTDSDIVFSRGSSLYIDTESGIASQTVTIETNTNYTLTAFVNGNATLGADVDGTTYESSVTASDFELTSVSFNSGSATSVTIYGTLSTDGTSATFDSFRLVSHETL
jgi:poly(beta-D-mannuronate) lyase